MQAFLKSSISSPATELSPDPSQVGAPRGPRAAHKEGASELRCSGRHGCRHLQRVSRTEWAGHCTSDAGGRGSSLHPSASTALLLRPESLPSTTDTPACTCPPHHPACPSPGPTTQQHNTTHTHTHTHTHTRTHAHTHDTICHGRAPVPCSRRPLGYSSCATQAARRCAFSAPAPAAPSRQPRPAPTASSSWPACLCWTSAWWVAGRRACMHARPGGKACASAPGQALLPMPLPASSSRTGCSYRVVPITCLPPRSARPRI